MVGAFLVAAGLGAALIGALVAFFALAELFAGALAVGAWTASVAAGASCATAAASCATSASMTAAPPLPRPPSLQVGLLRCSPRRLSVAA